MVKVKGLQYAEYTKSQDGEPASYHLYNQTYEFNYYLVIGQNKKMLDTWPFVDGHLNDAFCFLNSDGQPVIWLKEKGMLDFFAHEIVHAISYTYKDKGIKYDIDNDEPQAYLMSWLFRGFYFAVK